MELIKIEKPIKENFSYDLTEEKADALFEEVKYNASCDTTGKSSESINEISVLGAIALGGTVLYIIASIVSYIRNKYRLTVQKVYDQSKELNDIYTKVEDLLKNDKMARFKHRNDLMDCVIDSIVMVDKNDARKVYQLKMDYLAYDPEYFIKEIDSIVDYIQNNKDGDIAKMEESLMRDIDDYFKANHGYIETCTPVMKTTLYKNTKLETCVTEYKDWVSYIYEIMTYYNKYVADELLYMQLIEKAYKSLIIKYKGQKQYTDMIDRVFKKLLAQETMSIEFNQKSMDILTVMIKNYSDRLTVIYDKLKEGQ